MRPRAAISSLPVGVSAILTQGCSSGSRSSWIASDSYVCALCVTVFIRQTTSERGVGMLPRGDVVKESRSGLPVFCGRILSPCRVRGVPAPPPLSSRECHRCPPCEFAVRAYGSADVPGRWKGRFHLRSEGGLHRLPEGARAQPHLARSRRHGPRAGTPSGCSLAAGFVTESSAEARGPPPECDCRIALCVPRCPGGAGGVVRWFSRKGLLG